MGARGRKFKSCLPDVIRKIINYWYEHDIEVFAGLFLAFAVLAPIIVDLLLP